MSLLSAFPGDEQGVEVLEVWPVPQMGSKADILAKLRTQLFGNKTADSIESDPIMDPVWRAEDEADESWWMDPETAK